MIEFYEIKEEHGPTKTERVLGHYRLSGIKQKLGSLAAKNVVGSVEPVKVYQGDYTYTVTKIEQ